MPPSKTSGTSANECNNGDIELEECEAKGKICIYKNDKTPLKFYTFRKLDIDITLFCFR